LVSGEGWTVWGWMLVKNLARNYFLAPDSSTCYYDFSIIYSEKLNLLSQRCGNRSAPGGEKGNQSSRSEAMANPNPNQSLVKYDNAILVSTTKDKKGKKGKKGGKEQVSFINYCCSGRSAAAAAAAAAAPAKRCVSFPG
jgi:hypothetical protein